MSEIVTCVSKGSLESHIIQIPYRGQRFIKMSTVWHDDFIKRLMGCSFGVPRDYAETTNNIKQIIPYVLIHNVKDDTWFVHYRTDKQSESRLHNCYALGLGGHMNPPETIFECAKREVSNEEIELDAPLQEKFSPYGYNLETVGFINDNTTDVGSMHFAVVLKLNVQSSHCIKIRETDKMTGEFLPAYKILEYVEDPKHQVESWSKLVFTHIIMH